MVQKTEFFKNIMKQSCCMHNVIYCFNNQEPQCLAPQIHTNLSFFTVHFIANKGCQQIFYVTAIVTKLTPASLVVLAGDLIMYSYSRSFCFTFFILYTCFT